jgi:lycopene beta-cyclase
MAFREGSGVSGSRPRLIIAGGGLAGCLAALALAKRRPELPFLLVEQGRSFGGNHIWSFFDGDIAPRDRWLIEPLVTQRWPDHEVRFPARRRSLGFAYNSIRSEDLDRIVRASVPPDRYRLGTRILEIGSAYVLLEGGERIEAEGVIDARGPGSFQGLDLAWQKFVGRTYGFVQPHGSQRPVIMDALVDQDSGYRFVYTLPFSATQLMVEDTYYSTSPVLDVAMVRGRLDSYMRRGGFEPGVVTAEETGVLPVLLGGRIEALWPEAQPAVARLGLRGGFFHPTTGYSLPDATRNAVLLAQQRELSSAALHQLFRDRAGQLWSERSFYQLLNRMLFRAAEPRHRYRVLEHFYRLPEPVIARFYAGQLTAFDKLRILSGRPPVPVGRALKAMRSTRP